MSFTDEFSMTIAFIGAGALRSERYDVGISEAWNFGLFVVHHLIRLPTTIAISAQPIYPHLSYVSGLLEN
jgi:hypothetical protein